MSDGAKSPLAELREVEERLAVRMARIDQLQAAATSSQPRSLRFARTLVIVGLIGATPTSLFGLQRSDQWTLDVILAAAAFALAVLTGFFSIAVHKLADKHVGMARLAVKGLAIVARRNPSWQPFPLLTPTDRPDLKSNPSSRPALWLLAAAPVALSTVSLLGSVALALFALLLASGLLRLIWSRQAVVPGTVQVAAVLVSIVAALSVGSWAGGFTTVSPWIGHASRQLDRAPKDGRGMAGLQGSSPTSATPGSPPPTYESLCGSQHSPLSRGQSRAITQLNEAWRSAGALVAGCPGPVFTVSPDAPIVASIGTRDGRILSLGVAGPDRGILLYGTAAAAVHNLMRETGLLSVPTHITVGGGDLYLVDTPSGTYVLIRKEDTTACEGSPEGTKVSGCSGGAYSVVLPALARLWLGTMAHNGGWLWPEPTTTRANSQNFEFRTNDSIVVARASCNPADGVCERSGGSSYVYGNSHGRVSAEEILRYAPTSSTPE